MRQGVVQKAKVQKAKVQKAKSAYLPGLGANLGSDGPIRGRIANGQAWLACVIACPWLRHAVLLGLFVWLGLAHRAGS